MTTEVRKAIRTLAAWTADQTAMEALYGVGGYYTTLSAWEAAQQGDLVTANQIRTAVCYDDWPTGLPNNVTIDGSTTDATRYMKVTVAEGHRHDGTPRTGFWMQSTSQVQLIRIGDPYTVLEWIDGYCTSTGNDTRVIFVTTGPGNIVRNCIGEITNQTADFVMQNSGVATAQYEGCLTIGGENGISAGAGAALNCVATGASTGFQRVSAAVYKNCVAYNNTTNWGAGSYGAACTNNATSSTTNDAPGPSPVSSVTSAAFVNAAANDYHLASGSVLIGAGVNLYSDFTTDIDGDTWPSSGAWDIGFDYFTSGAPAIPFLTALARIDAARRQDRYIWMP